MFHEMEGAKGSLSRRAKKMSLGSAKAFMLSKTLDVAAVTDERATTAASSWDGLMARMERALVEVERRIDGTTAGGGRLSSGGAGATVEVACGKLGGGAKGATRDLSTQAGTRQGKGC